MFRSLYFSFRSIKSVLTLLLATGVLGMAAAQAQESRPVLDFEGNKVFSKEELLGLANKCLDRWSNSPYETDQLDYCLQMVQHHMRSKGYLQTRFEKTLYQQTETGQKALIPVVEGPLFRIGKFDVKNAKVLTPAQLVEMIGLNPGDIANGEKVSNALFDRAKEAYANLGYIQFTVEITPTFNLKEGETEGVVDFAIDVEEGQQYKIRTIRFAGGDEATTDMLRRELMVRDGEVYNAELFRKSITRINNTGLFDQIDADRDVDVRTDKLAPLLDLTIKLKKKVASSGNP